MVLVIHASAEDMETRAIKCVVPDVCHSHVIDRVGPALMDVDRIGRGSIVIVCSSQ